MPKTFEQLSVELEEQAEILKSQSVIAALAISNTAVVSKGLAEEPMQAGFALTEFAQNVQAVTIQQMQIAINEGYTQELEGRTEIAENDKSNITLDFTFDSSDESGLMKWPILGHTIDEIAIHLAQNLTFTIQTILANFTTGAITPEQLPQKIEEVQQVFSRQLATNVTSAQLAGAQAGRELVRSAIGAAAN